MKAPDAKDRRFRGFHLDPVTDEHLRHACAASDISVSEFVRQAVKAKLERTHVSV